MAFINGIIQLGPTVMMPIIFFILALIFRVRVAQGFKAAMLIGIGFVGINLVISLLLDTLGPAAESMVKRFDLNLTVVDPGWPVGATIGWGTPIVPFVVFGAIVLNIVLLLLKLTKTVNIDIFNYWHFMLTGGVVYAVTDSIIISVVSALLHFWVAIVIADLTAKKIQQEYNLKGVSFAHATSAIYVPIGIAMNWIIERIPVLNKVKASPEEITKKYGVMGEPLTLGTILGVLLGILAGLNITDILTLGIKVAAVMVLLPAMINILVQGLEIVREAAEILLKSRFPDREFYIGLDTALLVGNSSVLATGLLLIPGALLLAVILPGNKVLPFVDLASLVFLLPMAAPFLQKNLVRLFITGMVMVTFVLYAGTSIAPYYTKAAEMVNVTLPENLQSATELANLIGGATSPLGWLIIEISKLF